MPTESILVIDDNPQNAKLVSFLLTARGYAVKTAGSADEALELLALAVPRLILMDLQLPGMDGLALTRKLKADPRTQRTFIVAFTAYAMKGDEQRALDAGCDAYLTKPIDTRTLPTRIADYLVRGSADEQGTR
ncbi:MAG: response regulator [Deltaproteobacteria bacterium]|nr:response regulator [Deltaproteobacteria bacterium]